MVTPSPHRDPTRWQVTFDAQGITCRPAWGTSATVPWEDLQSVEIQTTRSGPIGLDIWWLVHGLDLTLSVPAGAQGEDTFLAKLQTLEGFDNQAVNDAMASVEEARWLVWRRGP